MPPSYTILYEVAKLPEEELKHAIKENVINPNMTRAELERWVDSRRGGGEGGETEEKESYRLFATLRAPASLDKDKEVELEAALGKLMADFGLAVERPRNIGGEALTRIVGKIDDYIRKGARLYIRNLKSATIGDRPTYLRLIVRSFGPLATKSLQSALTQVGNVCKGCSIS